MARKKKTAKNEQRPSSKIIRRRSSKKSTARADSQPTFLSKCDALSEMAHRDSDERLKSAIKAWKKLSQKSKMILTSAVVETRGLELRLAYPDIISVGHGFRTINVEERILTREPCVIFLVKRKRKRVAKDKRLPAYLYSYWGGSGTSMGVLCAVPTDIESGHQYTIKPHANPQSVHVSKSGLRTQKGVITCAVGLSNDTNIYAMSCHHVLAMSTVNSPPGRAATGARVRRAEATEFGKLSTWKGQLVAPSRGPSFDAALATVSPESVDELVKALGGAAAKSWSKTKPPPLFAKISTPGGIVSVEYVQTWSDFSQIAYFPNSPQPIQPTIVEWMVTSGSVAAGDSGSPVFKRNGTLLGMHIAGSDGGGRAFMLPAELLMFGPNFGFSGSMKLMTIP